MRQLREMSEMQIEDNLRFDMLFLMWTRVCVQKNRRAWCSKWRIQGMLLGVPEHRVESLYRESRELVQACVTDADYAVLIEELLDRRENAPLTLAQVQCLEGISWRHQGEVETSKASICREPEETPDAPSFADEVWAVADELLAAQASHAESHCLQV